MPIKEQKFATPVGTEVVIERPPGGAPTLLIDGLAGIALSTNLIKIDLYEQLIVVRDDGKAGGRHVITLALAKESFAKIVGALQKVLDENLAPGEETE